MVWRYCWRCKEVKLFGIQENKRAEFADRQLSVINKQKKMNMLAQWNGITDNIIVHLLTSLIYIIGANFVFDMQLSVGSVFAFITYSAYVTGPISAILNIGYLLSGIIPSTKRYYEFMALEEEKENEEGMTEPCFGDLELQNLSFSYEKDKAVLSDINIAFPKGSKTVLIGRNGFGEKYTDKSVAAIIPTYRRKNNIKWYRYFGVCFERIQKYDICSKPGDLICSIHLSGIISVCIKI